MALGCRVHLLGFLARARHAFYTALYNYNAYDKKTIFQKKGVKHVKIRRQDLSES